MKPSRHPFLGTLAAVTAFGVVPFASAASVTWNVAGNGTWDTTATNWTGGSPDASKYVNGDTANFNNTAGGNISLSGTIAPTATNVSAISGTYTFSGTGITSGTLAKSGAGTLVLSGANTYTGNTTISGGTLKVSGSGSINPTTGGALTLGVQNIGSGTFQYDSSGTSKFGVMSIGTAGTSGGGTLNQTNGVINGTSMTLGGANSSNFGGTVSIGNASGNAAEMNISGNVSVGGSGDFNSTLTVNSTGTLNVTGNLNMATSNNRSAKGTITQNAGSTVSAALLSLSTSFNDTSSRTHTSVYNLNGGTLSVGSITTGTPGAGTPPSVVMTMSNTFNFDGGTLKATGTNASFWANSANTTANVKNGGAKIDTNGKDITIGQSLLHFAGSTTDSLTKSGLGTLTLSGTNTYTGGTELTNGTLQFAKTAAMPSTGAVAVATGATLSVNLGGSNEWTTGTSGNGTIGGLLAGLGGQSGGTVTYAGDVKLGFDTTNASPSTQTYSGSIGNVGTTLGITKLGTNTLELSGGSSYSGGTTVSAGTLILSDNSAAGTTAGVVTVSGDSAILQISSGKTIENAITVSNATASVKRTVAGGGATAYTVGTNGNLKSDLTGGIDTTAKILAGTNSSASTAELTMKFGTTLPVTPSNDAIRRTDIFTLSGMTELDANPLTNYTDTFVIQLTAPELVAASGSVLGWNNGSDWVNAVTGNTGGSKSYFAGSFTSFLNNNAFNPATMLGAYGFDSSGGSVWAVVNHTGSFAAVPEPTSALAGLLIAAGLLRRRRA